MSLRKNKAFRILAGVLAVVACLWLVFSFIGKDRLWYEYLKLVTGYNPEKVTSRLLTLDTTPRHIQLGGKDYWVPANYDLSIHEPGIKQPDLMLLMLLPNFEPRTKDNIEIIRKTKGHGDKILLLVKSSDSPSDATVEQYFKNSMRRSISLSESEHTEIQKKYGMDFSHPIKTKDETRHYSDFYSKKKNGKVVTFIECTPTGGVTRLRSSGCNHYFMTDDLLVKANYHSKYLPQWQYIEDQTKSLLKKFRSNPSIIKGE